MARDLRLKDDFKHLDPNNFLKDCFCKVPFQEFHIFRDGYVSLCCTAWHPTEVGNINQQSLLEISNSPLAKKIRESVQNGQFNYCNGSLCGAMNAVLHDGRKIWPLEDKSDFERIHADDLSKKIKIYLSFDDTCNLACESCRKEKIFYDKRSATPELLATYEKAQTQIIELLDHGYSVDLVVTGSGDAFASPLYYELMCSLPETNKLGLYILTNGTMMTEKKLNMPTKKQIRMIVVSVDSCIPDRYSKIRKGGNFEYVQNNLDHLDRIVQTDFPSSFLWQINFIVQNDNYQELGDFVEWSNRFKTLNSIQFSKILDWGHLSSSAFGSKAVWIPDHPEHLNFLAKMKDPRLKNPRVILGNLTEYLES